MQRAGRTKMSDETKKNILHKKLTTSLTCACYTL